MVKRDTLLKKLESQFEKIQDALDNITSLLEIDNDDDELSEMSVAFREQIDAALLENPDCNYNDIVAYIKHEL